MTKLNNIWSRLVNRYLGDEAEAGSSYQANETRGNKQTQAVYRFAANESGGFAGVLDENKQFDNAAQLMMAFQYDACIDAYRELARQFPDKRNICEEQIGVACLFLGKYKNAIDYFTAARVHGAAENAIDDKVWNACRSLYKLCTDPVKKREPLKRYLTLFSNGQHSACARELIKD